MHVEDLNGLELLRHMWIKFEGGAAQVEVADLRALHTFPRCPDSSVLQEYLGERLAIAQEQGNDLPARHLTTLLTKMLPADVHADVKQVKLLTAPHMDIVAYLQTEADRGVDGRVAQHRAQRESEPASTG